MRISSSTKSSRPFGRSKPSLFPISHHIGIWPIFHTFRKGHKIWVQAASIDYSYQDHLNTIYTSENTPFPAENTIYHDLAHPSHLLLPVIPDATIIKPVEPPVSQIVWPPEINVFLAK
ncbi:MAG: CocE/NonD family hydrolase C-terminal non-catalytic domain-containing protein [Desulfobacterales bacterium]|nr:CocE/NonD family hydrolase C-terminal non-catalytic domain-containing protein [Desulfobacterales bacterium]